MGLATTPEYDELLARGYPHLRRLVEDHPHDADGHTWATKMLMLGDPAHYFVDWPAGVARRYLRGYAASRIENTNPPKLAAAAKDDAPIDAREAKRLVAAYLDPKHYERYDFHAAHALFLLEACVGSELVTDLVLSQFEAMKQLDARYSTRNAFAYDLGFVIRRLPRTQRSVAEARVRALVDKHRDGYVRDFLSYLVGGRAALEASGRRLGLYCLHFCDDPALIREVAAESVTLWDAQHVVLAGEALLEALTPKRLRDIWKPWKPLVIEQLGHLASPKAVAVLQEFGKTKLYAKQVEAILAARGARPAVKKAMKKAVKKATKK